MTAHDIADKGVELDGSHGRSHRGHVRCMCGVRFVASGPDYASALAAAVDLHSAHAARMRPARVPYDHQAQLLACLA